MKRLKNFIIPIFIPNEGCPHRCVFCDQRSISGSREKKVDEKEIRETVINFRSSRSDWDGRVELAFFGGTFTALAPLRQVKLLTIARSMIDEGLIDGIRLSTRPDAITEQSLDVLEEFGVETIELGVQSFVDDVLQRAKRGHTAKDSIHAAYLLKKGGISWVAQLMVGLPGDTWETMLFTAREVLKLSPDAARIYPCVVIRGTELEQMYNDGRFIPLTLDETVSIIKEYILIFNQAALPIIRIGVHPSRELESNIVAGPYHPALKSLVNQELLCDLIVQKVSTHDKIPDNVVVTVNPRSVSDAVGNRRTNIERIKQNLKCMSVRVLSDSRVPRGEVTVGGF